VRKLILLAIISLVLLAVAGAGQAANPRVLPAGSTPYGMTYGQWSAAWWQWAFSIPSSTNPLFTDGAVDCSYAQSGRVWFLVGVLNVSGHAERSCSIPSGTALFLPIINVECSTLEPPPFFGSNEAELRACAHSFGFTNLTAEIDGHPLEDLASYTADSPLYEFTVPDDNILGVPGGSEGLSVANGVYLFLAPLSLGEHTLHFGGTYPDFGGFTLDITYHLTVLPRGSA
jgi:hypothetical protein